MTLTPTRPDAALPGNNPARKGGVSDSAAQNPSLVDTPLLPDGFQVPASRSTRPSTRMRELLRTEPYLFGPGVYDPMGAQLAMYHGFKAVYFSGYSFAIGHLGTTDMDLYSSVEIADGARRTATPGHPARDRRHGRWLRERLQRPAHNRVVRECRRRCCTHRGPGSAQ